MKFISQYENYYTLWMVIMDKGKAVGLAHRKASENRCRSQLKPQDPTGHSDIS